MTSAAVAVALTSAKAEMSALAERLEANRKHLVQADGDWIALFADFATHRDGFGHWHNAANNDAVDVAVDHGVFICDKHFFDQKLITQPLSVQGFRMRTMDALSYVHIYLQ